MAMSRLNQEHTRTIRLVPYETHIATSSVMPDECQDEMMKYMCFWAKVI